MLNEVDAIAEAMKEPTRAEAERAMKRVAAARARKQDTEKTRKKTVRRPRG